MYGAPTGSPPRVRGKARVICVTPPTERITPACAGKSIVTATRKADEEDHPRVCGEKFFEEDSRGGAEGSPPRMRGKDLHLRLSASGRRITPAYAGKSGKHKNVGHEIEDHPRVCGEKNLSGPFVAKSLGSPPRVRGKAAPSPVAAPAQGITPACAGKSQ